MGFTELRDQHGRRPQFLIPEQALKRHMAEIPWQLPLQNRSQMIAFAAQMGLLRTRQKRVSTTI